MVPLDILAAQLPPADDGPSADELDWCFEDAELTQQLRAAKSGRGVPIAVLVGSALAMLTAITLFT